MQCDNGGNVLLSGNYIALNTSTTPVTICNSQNITASNNTLLNNPTSQFFTYDTTASCSTPLSSSISINGSSFNSSFPPPVNATPFTVQGTYTFNIGTSTSTTRSCATAAYVFIQNRVTHFILFACWMVYYYFH